MLRAQLHSFDVIQHFQRFLSTQVLWAHILFCYTADNTMQRNDFATKFAKLQLHFRILSQNCDWIFSLISSPSAVQYMINFYIILFINYTVPCKCKLTVSTRNSIRNPQCFRESRIEFRGLSFEFRGSSFTTIVIFFEDLDQKS